jgi:fibronectin type 3 domain-containing protein
MISIKIGEKQHDAMFTIRAKKIFKEVRGKDIVDITEADDDTIAMIYSMIGAAYAYKKLPMPVTIEEIEDGVEIAEIAKAIKSMTAPTVEGGE